MSSFFLIVVIVAAVQLYAWRKPKRRLPRGRDFDVPEQAAIAAFDPAAYDEPDLPLPDDDDDSDDPVWTPPATTAPVSEPLPARSDFYLATMRLAYAPGLCSPRTDFPEPPPRQE